MNTNHRKRPAMAKCSHKGNTKEDKAMTEHNLEQNKGKGKALMESTCEQGKGKGQANGNKCIKAYLKIKVNVHTGKAKVDEGVTKPMEDMDVDIMDMLENSGLTSVSKGNLPITFKHIHKLKTEMDMYEFQEGNDMSMVIINGNKKVYHGGGHQAAMREDFQNMVHHMMFQMWAASIGFLQCYVVGGHVNDFWDGIATPIKEPFTKDKMNDCFELSQYCTFLQQKLEKILVKVHYGDVNVFSPMIYKRYLDHVRWVFNTKVKPMSAHREVMLKPWFPALPHLAG